MNQPIITTITLRKSAPTKIDAIFWKHIREAHLVDKMQKDDFSTVVPLPCNSEVLWVTKVEEKVIWLLNMMIVMRSVLALNHSCPPQDDSCTHWHSQQETTYRTFVDWVRASEHQVGKGSSTLFKALLCYTAMHSAGLHPLITAMLLPSPPSSLSLPLWNEHVLPSFLRSAPFPWERDNDDVPIRQSLALSLSLPRSRQHSAIAQICSSFVLRKNVLSHFLACSYVFSSCASQSYERVLLQCQSCCCSLGHANVVKGWLGSRSGKVNGWEMRSKRVRVACSFPLHENVNSPSKICGPGVTLRPKNSRQDVTPLVVSQRPHDTNSCGAENASQCSGVRSICGRWVKHFLLQR